MWGNLTFKDWTLKPLQEQSSLSSKLNDDKNQILWGACHRVKFGN